MRSIIDLRAKANMAYDTEYHGGLRSRVWDALKGTPYDEHGHDTPGFSFGNPFPWNETIGEGDEMHVILSAVREDQLAYVVADLFEDRELFAGTMPFHVEDARPVDLDVGSPGTEGVFTTATGVYALTPPAYHDRVDDEEANHDRVYWRPKHGMEPFHDYIETQLQRQHDRFMPTSDPGPADVDAPLFEECELIKTYWLDVQVTDDVEVAIQLSKWRFPYIVRDDHHRRHLNLALDVGIGGRTPLGFGFLNPVGGDDD